MTFLRQACSPGQVLDGGEVASAWHSLQQKLHSLLLAGLRLWTIWFCNVPSRGMSGSNLFGVANGRTWRRVLTVASCRGGLRCASVLIALSVKPLTLLSWLWRGASGVRGMTRCLGRLVYLASLVVGAIWSVMELWCRTALVDRSQLLALLRACVLNFHDKWDKCLPLAEFSYNNNY
jgi:hypothetical protein